MTHKDRIENLIMETVDLGNRAATGFYPTKCMVCDDYKVRAGFKFTEDEVIHSCFRGKCDSNVIFKEGEPVSRKFKTVMAAYGITLPPEILMANWRSKKNKTETLDEDLYTKHRYDSIPIDDSFVKYNPASHPVAKLILESRGMTDDDYYVAPKGKYGGAIIIPFRFSGVLIGWQAYFHTTGKYITHTGGNKDLLFFSDGFVPETPIIVEGVFDAKSVPFGVACLGASIKKEQAYILRNTSPIVIPDRKDSKLMESAKRYGWRICIPDWNVNDANQALMKYGRLVVADKVREGIETDYKKAKILHRIWTKAISDKV